jgi:hypothetical protein
VSSPLSGVRRSGERSLQSLDTPKDRKASVERLDRSGHRERPASPARGARRATRAIPARPAGCRSPERFTGQAPPHADWICLAADGQDGITPTIRGTYDPAGIYVRLDIVALNSSSFIARKDQPGPCPGEDWQLIVSAGKQGRPGPPGAKGERGEPWSKGGPGAPAPTILAWKVDRESYTVKPIMSDASEVPAIEMRALFEKFHDERG